MEFFPDFKLGMWNAWLFMSVFLLQMLVIMLISRQVRERSHVPNEAKRNRLERYTGGLANLFWLLTLIYSVFLPLQTGTIWFYIGLAIYIIGLFFLMRATFDFITTPSNQIIQKGVYRHSRHPMYLATFLICSGCGFASNSWLFILITVLMAVFLIEEALIEERYCHEEYGNAYNEYMNRVPRWLGMPK